MTKLRKALIPAAGWGTRFLPASKAIPKEMAIILDRPAIQWIVEEAVAAGCDDVIVVTNEWKTALQNHFRPCPELEDHLAAKGKAIPELDALRELGDKVQFVFQQEQKGLGHAVLCGDEAVGDEPVLILLGDALVRSARPCALSMREVFEKVGGHSVIGLQQVPRERVSRYGVVAGEQIDERTYRLTDLVEKPPVDEAPSNLVIAGRYILTAGIWPKLREEKVGHGGEVQLTDAIRELLREEPVYGYVYEGQRHDIGNPKGYHETAVAYANDYWT